MNSRYRARESRDSPDGRPGQRHGNVGFAVLHQGEPTANTRHYSQHSEGGSMGSLIRHGVGRAFLFGLLLCPAGTQADSVDALRSACVAEVRQGGAPTRSPASACARYEEATQGSAPPDAEPARRARPAKAPSKPRKPRSSSSRATKAEAAQGDDCGGFDYGSIAYRHCRADEKKRLTKLCGQLSAKADRAHGEKRVKLKASAATQCRAARQYRIVD